MQKKSVTLVIPVDVGLTPILTGFVEQSGSAFGLMKREFLALTLAAEEVFTYIAATAAPDNEIQIICRNGGYYVEMAFQLKSGLLPLDAFNLTRSAVTADLEGVDQLGLILASRTVERLFVDRLGRDTFSLRFIVNRHYPAVEPASLPEPAGRFRIMPVDNATLLELAARVLYGYGDCAAAFLTLPGKLIDMVASGDYEAVVALDEKGRLGGGIVFSKNRKMAEAYGPYVFGKDERLPQLLVEKMIERLGRSQDTLCLVIMAPTPQTPVGYFERLPGGAVYRQLAEDDGTRIFTHPCFKNFLEDFYANLALPRAIQNVVYMGEEVAQESALATAIDRQTRSSELTLLWAGQNLEDNLRAHVKLLQSQNIETITFSMRLGAAEEVLMAPLVLAAGFAPVMVLPWARQGDVAIFRYRGRE